MKAYPQMGKSLKCEENESAISTHWPKWVSLSWSFQKWVISEMNAYLQIIHIVRLDIGHSNELVSHGPFKSESFR
jgi:hypothetical protein